MPQFENVTENKHIVVTYSLKDNKITINKVDNVTREKLQGAKFKLDQIDEREEPNNSQIIGSLNENGQTYYYPNLENNITSSTLGSLTNNGTYYFVKNEDGTYTPTNSKTYQLANGETAGIGNTTANSYMKIDLSGLTGKYYVAKVSSQSNYDYGYATINQSETAPAYNTSTGRFIYISGNTTVNNTPTDYISGILEGGQEYYLHLGYRKNASTDTGDDQIVINSVNVYGTTTSIFNFNEVDGKYKPRKRKYGM